MQAQLAYTIPDAVKMSGIKRDGIYAAVNTGLLIAKKYGNRTIIMHDALLSFLTALPDYVPAAADAPKPGRKRGRHAVTVSV